ncbi:MAG TPA: sigma-54 dependent transcriptional regulator [Candidatus Eisenbacteria bacterium]|nr:sigma-54 dependent transcriptional regulator [Candidatus Eisenbacteria bacterium]
MPRNKILVIEDEPGVRFGLRDFLESSGFEVEEADTWQAALEAFQLVRPDAAIIDYALPDGNALELLPRLKQIDPEIPLIILTAFGSIDLAVRAVKEGADQFLTKPVELPALLVMLERLLAEQRRRQRQMAGRSRRARESVDPFLGVSTAIRQLAELATKVLPSDSPILILGETGTGKGVLARWLRDNGPRADEAFVDLNCAGLSREFLETELFGHEKGAFTGAVNSKPGLLEIAHRGTVFLDEIGDMDLQIQAKLLKVLEEKRFRRLGDIRDRIVDIRLIAATHHDLGLLVQNKQFRSDLHFRINTLPLTVPPLRERREDIPVIARHLLQKIAADLGRAGIELAPDTEQALQTYAWPGNIRELRNVLERAVLLSDQAVLHRKSLSFDLSPAGDDSTTDSQLTLREMERRHIERVLRDEQGRVESAAKRLGIPRSTLYQKIKQYQISLPKL